MSTNPCLKYLTNIRNVYYIFILQSLRKKINVRSDLKKYNFVSGASEIKYILRSSSKNKISQIDYNLKKMFDMGKCHYLIIIKLQYLFYFKI